MGRSRKRPYRASGIMSMATIRTEIEDELFTALQAIEDGDLHRARGCTARAHADIIENWQQLRAVSKQTEESKNMEGTVHGRTTSLEN